MTPFTRYRAVSPGTVRKHPTRHVSAVTRQRTRLIAKPLVYWAKSRSADKIKNSDISEFALGFGGPASAIAKNASFIIRAVPPIFYKGETHFRHLPNRVTDDAYYLKIILAPLYRIQKYAIRVHFSTHDNLHFSTKID